MKTRDITDLMVCEANRWFYEARDADIFPYEHLARTTGAPEKVCLRAYERAIRHGLIEVGSNELTGWLTEEGKALLRRWEGIDEFFGSQPPVQG